MHDIHYTGKGFGVPKSLTGPRLKSILSLVSSQEQAFKNILNAKASEEWKSTEGQGDLYARMVILLSTPKGRLAYMSARDTFEKQKTKLRRRVDITYRIIVECSNLAGNQINFDRYDNNWYTIVLDPLAKMGAWSNLAEITWALSIIEDGRFDYIDEMAMSHPELESHFEKLTTGDDKKEDEEVGVIAPEKIGEASRLVKRICGLAEDLSPDHLDAIALQDFSHFLKRLGQIAVLRTELKEQVSVFKTQIQEWLQSHEKAVEKVEVCEAYLATLKNWVECGTATEEVVKSTLSTISELVEIKQHRDMRQADLLQSSSEGRFDDAKKLIEELQSIDQHRDATEKIVETILADAPKEKAPKWARDDADTVDEFEVEDAEDPTGLTVSKVDEEVNAESTAETTPEPIAVTKPAVSDSRNVNRSAKTQIPTGDTPTDKQQRIEASTQDAPLLAADGATRVEPKRDDNLQSEVDGEALEEQEMLPPSTVDRSILAAIERDRFGVAYHLALANPEATPSANTIKLIACNYAAARRSTLRSEISDLASDLALRVMHTDDNSVADPDVKEEAILIACAALSPAIACPGGSVAELLSALEIHLEDIPSLRKVVDVAATVSRTGVDLPASSLKEDDTIEKWKERETALRTETADWLDNVKGTKIRFHAATTVWRRMLEDWQIRSRSSLGRLMTLLSEPVDAIDVDEVAQITEYWRNNFDREIDRIDRENRRRASVKKIEGSARTDIRQKIDSALSFAERWLELINERPDKQLAYPIEQAKLLRNAVNKNSEKALEEIDGLEFPYRASARTILDRYAQLFSEETAHPKGQPVSLESLLNIELLVDPDTKRNSDGTVDGSSIDEENLRKLANAEELNFEEAAMSRVDAEELGSASALIDFAASRRLVDEAVASRVRSKVGSLYEELTTNLNRRMRETTDRIDAAYASGALSLESSERLSGKVGQPEHMDPSLPLEFRKSLDAIDQEITVAETSRRDALMRAVESLPKLADSARVRIVEAIGKGLFQTAQDFIERCEHGESLPAADIFSDHPFDHFFPNFADQYAAMANFGGGLDGVRKQIRNGDKAGVVDFSNFTEDQRQDAIAFLDSWLGVCNGKTSIAALTKLMKSLGFKEVSVKGSSVTTQGGEMVHLLQTATISDRRMAQLPEFGSSAEGRYRVFAIRGRNTAEPIIRESRLRETVGSKPSIVLFLGVLDSNSRRSLARDFRTGNYFPTLVLDEALTVYLATQHEHRLAAFFDCASGFAFSQPFDPDAVSVPPEMFFGRNEARKAILSTSGDTAHFLYGGRRLGKTALLSSIAHQHHSLQKIEPKQVVQFISLKGSGIGEVRPTHDLWKLFSETLSGFDVLKGRTVHYDAVEKEVRKWLGEHRGRRILFLVDESDAFLAAEREPQQGYRVLDQIKQLMDKTERRFKVVFAGLHNVQRAAQDPNTPFAHLGDAIQIGPMLPETDQDAIQKLIRYPLEALGYRFASNDSVIRIAADTNYYPALAQQFCKELLKHLCGEAVSHSDPGPPFTIETDTVDGVLNAKETRERIRNLFSWTIQLDPRYEFLTYLIARKSFDNEEMRPQPVSIIEIRDTALRDWRKGFASDSSYWMFEVLLEEMVGLGIIRELEEKHFAIRSSNLRMLLGSDEEIEQRFLDAKNKQPPEMSDPAQFRSTLPELIPSSLTADQERRLLSNSRSIGLIFSGRLAGIERVCQSLQQANGGRGRPLFVEEVNPEVLTDALLKASRRRKSGIFVLLIDLRGAFDIRLIEHAITFVAEHASQNRFIRPVFLCGPEEAWKWLSESSRMTHKDVKQLEVWLGPCAVKFTRDWLSDQDSSAYADLDHVDQAVDHPWPGIVGIAAKDKQLSTIKEAAEAAWAQKDGLKRVSDVLISENVKSVLKVFIEFPGESIAVDDISDLLLINDDSNSMTQLEIEQFFDWADRLGIIHRDGTGYRLDSIYAGGLDKVLKK